MKTNLMKSPPKNPTEGFQAHNDRQRQRFIYAVAAVVALAVVFVGVCLLSRSAETDEQQDHLSADETYVTEIKDEVLAGGDIQTSLSEAGFDLIDTCEVPNWFEEEILTRDEMAGGMASSDWSTVGFSRQGDADAVLEALSKTFTEKGWQGFDSGMEGVATFIKEKGTCSWMMINCIETGDSVSVVLRIQHI